MLESGGSNRADMISLHNYDESIKKAQNCKTTIKVLKIVSLIGFIAGCIALGVIIDLLVREVIHLPIAGRIGVFVGGCSFTGIFAVMTVVFFIMDRYMAGPKVYHSKKEKELERVIEYAKTLKSEERGSFEEIEEDSFNPLDTIKGRIDHLKNKYRNLKNLQENLNGENCRLQRIEEENEILKIRCRKHSKKIKKECRIREDERLLKIKERKEYQQQMNQLKEEISFLNEEIKKKSDDERELQVSQDREEIERFRDILDIKIEILMQRERTLIEWEQSLLKREENFEQVKRESEELLNKAEKMQQEYLERMQGGVDEESENSARKEGF